MIPMFTHDVDGKPRNNKRLLPKRNWCSISEYVPGTFIPQVLLFNYIDRTIRFHSTSNATVSDSHCVSGIA